MTTLTAVNQRDLYRQFCVGTKAEKAWRALQRRKDDEELARVLRHHSKKPPGRVSDPKEIEFRDRVDDLLEYFGLLEIALHIGFIDRDDDPDYWRDALRILNYDAVRAFYSNHYPQRLPDLLRGRLENRTRHKSVDAPPNLFIEFLSLSRRLNTDPDLLRFLAFMDSFYFGEVTFSDVLEVLEDPAQVARHVLRRRPEPIGQALRGFDKMLQFIVTFDSLSRRAKKWRTFEARLWHSQAYWFRQMRVKFGSDLEHAVKLIASWRADEMTRNDCLDQARHVDLLQSAVRNVVFRREPFLKEFPSKARDTHEQENENAVARLTWRSRRPTRRRRGRGEEEE